MNHELLILKLSKLGLNRDTLKAISSYLPSREFIVRINGNSSDSFIADCGIPQESLLGRLLFIIFINCVGDVVKSVEFQVYADDIKIYFEIEIFANQIELQRIFNVIYNSSHFNIDF